MKRRWPLLVVLLAIGAAVAFALASKQRGRSLEPTLTPYVFASALPAAHPPEAALRSDALADPVKRALLRVEWGTPDIFYWSQRHLPADPQERAALARALVSRYEKVLVGAPLLGARFLQAIGMVADPVGLPTLERAARTPPALLQIAALHALSGFPLTDRVRDLYISLSTPDTPEEVRNAAEMEFLKRDVLGDAAMIKSFLEQRDGGEAVPWLLQVSTRKLTGLEDSCARHLASASPRARRCAILALVVLGDPRGMAAAREELQTTDLPRLTAALTIFRDGKATPPRDEMLRLADHKNGEVRKGVAQALGPWCTGPDEAWAVALLSRLTIDPDPVVQRTAIEQLWKHGRTEGLASWRESLRSGHGNALREAAQLLCETLKDPAAPPIIRARLGGEKLDGNDQANLLYGLRFFTDPADLPLFLSRIERAGGEEDVRVGDHSWLSEFASIYVQTFGAPATAPLVESLARVKRARAELVVIDTLRGVVRGAPAAAAAAERILALVCDGDADHAVRLAAIESIPFFDDAALGARLLSLREAVHDKRLADAITVVFASYF
jgi:HEAT repeat protein